MSNEPSLSKSRNIGVVNSKSVNMYSSFPKERGKSDNFVPGVSGQCDVQDGGVVDNLAVSAVKNSAGVTDSLVCITPVSSKGVSINIYRSCVEGSCQCLYELGGNATQLKPCRFGSLIFVNRDPSENEVKVFESILHGVDIVSSEVDAYECENYNSILEQGNKRKMDAIIEDELKNGILTFAKSKPTCVHALGAVDKPDGNIRPITDCSRPEGVSVNSHVEGLPISVKYKSVDDVVDMLNQFDYMGVIDIKSAYRSVSINPEHVRYQGLKWEFDDGVSYLEDHRLCFGLKCGPHYFSLISDFIQAKLVDLYGIRVVNYLDDYITISDSVEGCGANQLCVIKLLRYLGFQISWNKVSAPSQVTKYLGIDIDSVMLELRLPMYKVEKMLETVRSVLKRKVVSKKELQKLTGLLAHCATVVKGGRTYCRRLYDLEKVANKARGGYVRLSDQAREDLEWWEKFSEHFNGKSTIKKPEFIQKPTSDASLLGFGSICGNDWFCGSWTKPAPIENECSHFVNPPVIPEHDIANINVLELYPVLEGLSRWKNLFRGHRVALVIDNLQVFYMIRTGRSVNKTCMLWLREIFWLCALNDIEITSEYIPSSENVIADTLSRLDYQSVSSRINELLDGCDMCCKLMLIESSRFQAQQPKVEVPPSTVTSASPSNNSSKEDAVELLSEILC